MLSSGLRRIEKGAFFGLAKLEILLLSANELHNMDGINGLGLLERLGMQLNQLSEVLYDALGGVHNLKHLDIAHNRIRYVFPDVFGNSSVESFKSRNQTRVSSWNNTYVSCSHDYRHYPAPFLNLTDINLRKNELQILPYNFILFPSLRQLDISHNGIAELPTNSFCGLANLETLNLNYNNLTYLQKDVFSALCGLKVLSIERNQLVEIEKGAMDGLCSLRTLTLSGNPAILVTKEVIFAPSHVLRMFQHPTNCTCEHPLVSHSHRVDMGSNLYKPRCIGQPTHNVASFFREYCNKSAISSAYTTAAPQLQDATVPTEQNTPSSDANAISQSCILLTLFVNVLFFLYPLKYTFETELIILEH